MEQIMYIDALALKYKIKFRHNPSFWNKVLVGIIYRMLVAGGLLSLAHRFEMVTTDLAEIILLTTPSHKTHSTRVLLHFQLSQ